MTAALVGTRSALGCQGTSSHGFFNMGAGGIPGQSLHYSFFDSLLSSFIWKEICIKLMKSR